MKIIIARFIKYIQVFNKYKMRYHELTEAPISDITHLGDWDRNSSFRHEQDRKLLTSPKALEKIKAKWNRTDQNFNMFFVNSPEANKFMEVGKVDISWLRENMPKTFVEFDPKYDPNAINIIFTNNKGDERVPMTAWIIAHRFGHAIQRLGKVYAFTYAKEMFYHYISEALKDYSINIPSKGPKWYRFEGMIGRYNIDAIVTKFFEALGTMKSARDGEIRNSNEFLLELLAQYMLTGKIIFNDLPKGFKIGNSYFRFRGTEVDYDYQNRTIKDDLSEVLESEFESMLNSVIGEIFVM